MSLLVVVLVAIRTSESGRIVRVPDEKCYYGSDGHYKLLPGGGRVLKVAHVKKSTKSSVESWKFM